jgi:hypothetical protein
LRDDDVKRRKEALRYARRHAWDREGRCKESHSDLDAVENRKKTGSGKKSKSKSEIAQLR